MSTDEISESNLTHLIETCEYLNNIRQKMLTSVKKEWNSYDILTGEKKKRVAANLYKVLLANNKERDELIAVFGETDYQQEHFLHISDHPLIQHPDLLKAYLTTFAAKIFQGYGLLLVNKEKGFFIAVSYTHLTLPTIYSV